MKILVTGATGKLGSIVVDTLLESVPAKNLTVSVRDPKKAESLRARGVEVRHGDFDRPETLDKAFKGVDRLLLVSADGDNEKPGFASIRLRYRPLSAPTWASSRIPALGMQAKASCSSPRYIAPRRTPFVKPAFCTLSYATTGIGRTRPQLFKLFWEEHLG